MAGRSAAARGEPLLAGRGEEGADGDERVDTERRIGNARLARRNLYNTILIGRLILTWFPNPPEALVGPLSTLADPYLNLFRGIVPPLGGTLDLSPILAFFALNIVTTTAAALPAEVDAHGEPVLPARSPPLPARAAYAVRHHFGHLIRTRRRPAKAKAPPA